MPRTVRTECSQSTVRISEVEVPGMAGAPASAIAITPRPISRRRPANLTNGLLTPVSAIISVTLLAKPRMVRNETRPECDTPASGEKTSPVAGMRSPKFSEVRELWNVIWYFALPVQFGKGTADERLIAMLTKSIADRNFPIMLVSLMGTVWRERIFVLVVIRLFQISPPTERTYVEVHDLLVFCNIDYSCAREWREEGMWSVRTSNRGILILAKLHLVLKQ